MLLRSPRILLAMSPFSLVMFPQKFFCFSQFHSSRKAAQANLTRNLLRHAKLVTSINLLCFQIVALFCWFMFLLESKIALYHPLAAKHCFCSVIFCLLLFFPSTLNTHSSAVVTLRFLLHISSRVLCLTCVVLCCFRAGTLESFFLQQSEAAPREILEKTLPPQSLLKSFFQFTQIWWVFKGIEWWRHSPGIGFNSFQNLITESNTAYN